MQAIGTYLIPGADKILLAHTPREGEDKLPETLIAHSDLVLSFAEKLSVVNGLTASMERAVQQLKVHDIGLEPAAQQQIRVWFTQAIYLHDLGKINPVFQKKKIRNKEIAKLDVTGDTKHALLSALLYLHILLPEVEQTVYASDFNRNRSVCKFMKHILYVFAYIISRHHTYLGHNEELVGELTRFEKDLQNLQEQLVRYPDYLHYYKDKTSLLEQLLDKNQSIVSQICVRQGERLAKIHSPFPFYVLSKLLYSTMVACDFYATHAYDTGIEFPFRYFGQDYPLEPILKSYKMTKLYHSVQTYRENPVASQLAPINKLRSELFLETEKQLQLQMKKQFIYYLEAPTGSGKTFMSLNLALQLLDGELGLNKLLYIFPFNALIEQTKQELDKIFPAEMQKRYRMSVVNSVTPIVTEQELWADQARTNDNDEEEPDWKPDYKDELMQRQMLQYPVTLTSHVNFFNYLFGMGRESNLAFTHLCNSVIILDEIQSYRNEIWKEIIHFLRAFAEILNMRIIIMSATLPQLDLLIEEQEVTTCVLVPQREHYFHNPLFRNRVTVHTDLLINYKEINEDQLLEAVQEVLEERKSTGRSTRLLIEFITKKTARSFYQRLQNLALGIPLYELTGDDNNLLRKKVLAQLGKDQDNNFLLPDAIVVATQVIEAGVDIDMDIGFKDISMLDSEEQFLGRINRSCLREDCHGYFFNMIEASKVYRKDWRTERDLRSPEYQRMLVEKDFKGFYALCMRRLNESRAKGNDDNWANFLRDVQQLNFPSVEKQMQLITNKTYTLFIEHDITYTDEQGDIVNLCGSEVWAEFKYWMKDKETNYEERMIKLSQVRAKLDHFTYVYGVQREANQGQPKIYDHIVGSLYYVRDGQKYMIWDELTGAMKFDRSAYMGDEESI
ncbi:CRISPR-associated helicase Cas3' [Paenibacillus sp. SYP-B3998]|uniref:CRISPR-associated helicase Cas3 n=1 Tax=Paenibacillus sp. SYP-B3998 TaxID=2678564 RepID=A0A6G4A0E5_9BACL|nr:CRISPR-associated helicase Cas3' [Paenibacillus sp. SYP-B3998]NEW07862.1 CRISPR-associated helicase Cas3' [Paenibacillus sp. SYP-B3998]